ncbi:MAG TPA: DUF1003 domain-containing protein [Candidatus Pacearchaeota archaeon]|nr:DUF1003 domain-containing protein [Candidatus Pacearchaeota archaeon]
MPKKGDIRDEVVEIEDKLLHVKLDKPFRLQSTTMGQRAADWLTRWAGSWVFIISVGVFMFFWISINTSWLVFGREWDPYPFILLNFVLSTLAAIQAPIILMSQNRESQKDRARSEYDYAVNKKAEKEIREIKVQLDKIERKFGRK